MITLMAMFLAAAADVNVSTGTRPTPTETNGILTPGPAGTGGEQQRNTPTRRRTPGTVTPSTGPVTAPDVVAPDGGPVQRRRPEDSR